MSSPVVRPDSGVTSARPFRKFRDMNPSTIDSAAFDRGIDPILQFFTLEQAREIVDYRGDASLQQRIEELASKANEGELNSAERAEYEGYIRANKFLAILQAAARKLLASAKT
jgi:hypothetical protein